ncbi:MFS general substrate transporter [Periconia macrospinosa]|uniref:MFS general substrate transporter n=1 Tax=Periconia macrospinosa TaxID=97972 RepID=A0A2V1DZ70_9PLEO|nr:MFS general substrate transporter [Periconia macrospinosa]
MADPEIELPMTSAQLRLSKNHSAPGISRSSPPVIPEKTSRQSSTYPTSRTNSNLSVNNPREKSDDGEKTPADDDDEVEQNAVGAIVYYYLTEATVLPSPTSIIPTREGQAAPPEPPDIREFGSPFEWPERRKSLIIWISCIVTSLTAFSAGSYSPGVAQMTEEWNISNVAALVGITMFTMGFAIAPMILAPFSEINGRRPVFIASGILFVVCQLCTGLTQSYAGMLVVRFFAGVGGSTFSTMGALLPLSHNFTSPLLLHLPHFTNNPTPTVGGVVSDIYHTADRNTPMAIFSGGALFGTGLGPLVSGFIAQNTSWRWIFYTQTISCSVCVGLICIVFKETRGSVLLSRKARALNKWYEAREQAGYYNFNMPVSASNSNSTTSLESTPLHKIERIRWKVKEDEQRTSLTKSIGISLFRPFHLLFTEPVVFFFSLWVAFSWAVLYLTLAAIPLVFQTTHHFSLQTSNAVFAAMCVGAVLATVLSIHHHHLLSFPPLTRLPSPSSTPEGRLYFACIESVFMPIGLFMFGWTGATHTIHWIVPSIAITLATIGIFSIYLSTFNYLADTYHRYASSALAAQSFCRNMLGGVFPLITTQMYNRLGFGGASSMLGGIGALLTLVPWVLVVFGPRIRRRSRFAKEIMEG